MAIPRTIRIGYVGDKMYRHQDIDISDLLVDYPTAVATLYHKRASDDDGYPVVTEMVDSHTLRWTFSDVDAAEKGYGEAVIVMATSDGAHIGRSHVIETVTGRSIVTDEDVPEAYTPYINQVSTLKAQMKKISDHIDSVAEQIDVDTIKAEIDSAKTTAVNAVSAQGSSSKTVVANQGTASKAEVTAQATKAKGEINTLTSGFSATVAAGVASVQSAQTTAQTAIDTKRASFETYATSQFEEIATKTTEAKSAKDDAVSAKNEAVVAKTGAESALTTIQQKLASGEFKGDKGDTGSPGTNGVDGQNGADGFSPTATVTKTGNTATISITDKNGTTTATVSDGEKFPSVVSLDADTDLVCGKVIETVGVPKYVGENEFANYSTFGITETGWYVFARITSKQGVTVASGFSVTGATKYIMPSVGGNYVDVAVRFGVASESKKVVVNWGSIEDVYVFKATDLAVRNLDYRTTFYVYDIAPYTTETDEKITFSGMVHNVTYKHTCKIDKPIEIVLPTIDSTDGHGVWMEIQLLFNGVYSCTLTTLDNTAVIKNNASPTIKNGYNVLDLMYYDIDGVKAWRVQNTTSDIF